MVRDVVMLCGQANGSCVVAGVTWPILGEQFAWRRGETECAPLVVGLGL